MTAALSTSSTLVLALLPTVRVNTHAVRTSVRFHGTGELPFQGGTAVRDGVTLEQPASAATSTPALQTLIEPRSSGEGFVIDAGAISVR